MHRNTAIRRLLAALVWTTPKAQRTRTLTNGVRSPRYTYDHPEEGQLRIDEHLVANGVTVDLVDEDHLESIYIAGIYSEFRRSGFGTAALRRLCEIADSAIITLRGEVRAYNPSWEALPNTEFLTTEKLLAWYARFGFVPVGTDCMSGHTIVARPPKLEQTMEHPT